MEATLLDRLCRAINSHDLEGIAACFAADYRCDIPLHPARSFTGRDQVRANWAPLLKAVPDLTAAVTVTVTRKVQPPRVAGAVVTGPGGWRGACGGPCGWRA